MPGTPVKNKMLADIQALGGDEVLLDRIADGALIKDLATELGVSRPFLSGHLNRNPLMKQKLAEAKKGRAEMLAEDSLKLADDVRADPNEINKVKTQIEVRKWLAGVDDPERFGPKGHGVTVNVGALHLDALRHVQSEAISAPDVVEGAAEEVTDAEVS